MSDQIISMQHWLNTPPGRYLLAWERAQCDAVVADMFGYHALQLGLPALAALQNNRIAHRWLAVPNVETTDKERRDSAKPTDVNHAAEYQNTEIAQPPKRDTSVESLARRQRVDIVSDFAALPFFENSLDVLVLPHSLELSIDPHATLREAQRVLVSEGKLIISCFNPLSLWGLKQRRDHLYRRCSEMFKLGKPRPLYLPEAGEFIGCKRVRDWLSLLNFEIEDVQFGCYRPSLRSDKWLQRTRWIDDVGARYWPIFGSVYFIVAVKRVHGARLISPAWKKQVIRGNAPVSVASQALNKGVNDKFES